MKTRYDLINAMAICVSQEIEENQYLTDYEIMQLNFLPYRSVALMNDKTVDAWYQSIQSGYHLTVRKDDNDNFMIVVTY